MPQIMTQWSSGAVRLWVQNFLEDEEMQVDLATPRFLEELQTSCSGLLSETLTRLGTSMERPDDRNAVVRNPPSPATIRSDRPVTGSDEMWIVPIHPQIHHLQAKGGEGDLGRVVSRHLLYLSCSIR